jgi:hypothetical protein
LPVQGAMPFDLEFDTGSLRLPSISIVQAAKEGFLDDFQCLRKPAM